MKLSNRLILFLILLTAAALRLYKLTDLPYSHDEFSALFRTQFNTFSDLIEKGVKIDGHPAGIQVFLYYWTQIWGYTEWVVKIPFIIAGILSVLLLYLIARIWYNESVALISAAFLAAIQYSVAYSMIARPYISGLFFCLCMVYYWSQIIRKPEKRFYLHNSLFIISASLATYNHHFSLLFAAIVGLSGLFLIKRKYLLKYIFSGLIIIALYLPHLNILLYQMSVGGVEGWLAKPHNDFLIQYLDYIFHFSALCYALLASLIIFGLIKIRKEDLNLRSLTLFASWFLLPFLIGFFYSKYVNSVLQYSVLIFSFPFLFFVLFGHIKAQNVKTNLLIVLCILSISIFTLIRERQFYNLSYHSAYEQILIDKEKAMKDYNKVVAIIDSHKKITDYYLNKHGFSSSFIWQDSFSSQKELIRFVADQSEISDYLYLGCMSGNDPRTIPFIRDYFPNIVWQNNYAGGTTYLFSKKEDKSMPGDILDFESYNFSEFWLSMDKRKFTDSLAFSGKYSYLIDQNTTWSPTYYRPLNDILKHKNNFIDISLKACFNGNYDDVFIVASLEAADSILFYGGTAFNEFIHPQQADGQWVSIHHSIKLSDIYLKQPGIKLKFFIHNQGHQRFLIDNFSLNIRDGNPVIYGLIEKI